MVSIRKRRICGAGGGLEAAQRVGGEGIHQQGQQHGQRAVDHGVEDAAAVEEDVVQHGPEVADQEFAADLRLVRAEQVGVMGELGHGRSSIQNPGFRIQNGGFFFRILNSES
jgi:hypothetical protein